MHAGLINWVALHKSSLVQKDFQMFTTNFLFSATHSLEDKKGFKMAIIKKFGVLKKDTHFLCNFMKKKYCDFFTFSMVTKARNPAARARTPPKLTKIHSFLKQCFRDFDPFHQRNLIK